MSRTSDASSPAAKARVGYVLTALGLWLQVVALHFLPLHTFSTLLLGGLVAAIAFPRIVRRAAAEDATPVSDLGERGEAVAASFARAAKRFDIADAKLLVREDDSISTVFARWLPGTDTLVLTRGAYQLPDAELEALWVLECAERKSRAVLALRSISVVRVLAASGTRLALIIAYAGSLSLYEAFLATILVFCVSRTITTSAPLLAALASRFADARAVALLEAPAPYVQVLTKMRDGLSVGNSSHERLVEHLDARIERLTRS